MNELLRGQVIAYSLNPDHTLKRIQVHNIIGKGHQHYQLLGSGHQIHNLLS